MSDKLKTSPWFPIADAKIAVCQWLEEFHSKTTELENETVIKLRERCAGHDLKTAGSKHGLVQKYLDVEKPSFPTTPPKPPATGEDITSLFAEVAHTADLSPKDNLEAPWWIGAFAVAEIVARGRKSSTERVVYSLLLGNCEKPNASATDKYIVKAVCDDAASVEADEQSKCPCSEWIARAIQRHPGLEVIGVGRSHSGALFATEADQAFLVKI